ncbi:MAG: sulfatase-like hydrolase/transferase, partial [Phycisphaerae bacterium]|nr:sulfatase-like hydrolase/transferase [Phycisphaerae bacterium]
FYGEITGMDRAIGKLRSTLRTLGVQDNTLLWYCSDNGGLPKLGATGGRGHKGMVYEGGLRVPAIIEWPARITKPARTAVPANTVDIFPTLLEVAGIELEDDRPLDGVALVELFNGRMTKRPRPMGFWNHPTRGIRTPSAEWMAELLEAQKAGNEIADEARLRLDAAKITAQYPEDSFPGHAAWLAWPWKLHRIQAEDGAVTLELYNLADDPDEKADLAGAQAERVQVMRADLEKWLSSVAASLNGKDYR